MDASVLTTICTIIAAQFIALIKFITDIKKLKSALETEKQYRKDFEKNSLDMYKNAFKDIFTPYTIEISDIKDELQQLKDTIHNNAAAYNELSNTVSMLSARFEDMLNIIQNTIASVTNSTVTTRGRKKS